MEKIEGSLQAKVTHVIMETRFACCLLIRSSTDRRGISGRLWTSSFSISGDGTHYLWQDDCGVALKICKICRRTPIISGKLGFWTIIVHLEDGGTEEVEDWLHKGNTDIFLTGQCISKLGQRLEEFVDGFQGVSVLPCWDEMSGFSVRRQDLRDGPLLLQDSFNHCLP
ncbi:hypothetical protein ROHU_002280 [Labeo rohita]|uniref:Uncharacterized protein n=1 Tax=Labeo rohita TaxID=84645 RepID=A0A498NZ20_LABRO|nr:hypothetical protein ROHU_006735 [Labeo rohita]RXN37163.1 hypothetical protein ROHU_002280 [Labeo rohita]